LARTVHSSVIAATAVPRNLQTTSSLSSTTTPISPASGGAQFQPGSTQPEPYYRDWSVEYNPEIKQNFSLHVANIFKNTAKVFCVKFSRDGKYLAVGLQNGEIHIYDILTGSKRSVSCVPCRQD
jgi:glucose repression regulatory protein TUP1